MGQLFPFIVLIIIVIAKVIAKAASGSGDGPSESAPPRVLTDSERERRRKFMEAMGLPADSDVPPIVRPRPVPNPPPLMPVSPPGALIQGSPGRLRRVPTIPMPTAPSPVVVRNVPPPPPPSPAVFNPQPVLVVPAMPLAAPAETLTVAGVAAAAMSSAADRPGAATSAPRLSYPAKSLLLRLRNPDTIREAIILREILGPPKALELR